MNRKFSVAIAVALLTMAGTAGALEVWLRADVTVRTMPDGAVITMWGFARDSGPAVDDGAVSIPGPPIVVPLGDNLLIHLKNRLTPARTGTTTGYPVSLIIPGQQAVMTPQYFGPTPYPEFEGRVRSLTHEAAPGGTADYSWPSFRAGSFIYHSATQMQVQVQMGLYGPVAKNSGPNQAYPGVNFAQQIAIFYSEIDPVLHQAVATNKYGPAPAGPPDPLRVTSTVDYLPKYFLVNGRPYTSASVPFIALAGQPLLIRLFNAGLQTHVPLFQGMYVNVVAEDGNKYPYPFEQYTASLPALKTKDVLLTPTAGTYAIYDRALDLTNAGKTSGGLFAKLQVNAN